MSADIVDATWDYWSGRDNDRFARGGILKRLAVDEADALSIGVPLSKFDAVVTQNCVRHRDVKEGVGYDKLK